MGKLFLSADEILQRPTFPGMPDPTHLHYHFRPSRPANLLVTRDPLSGEINLAAGTYGLLTDRPYTICLHISKHSYDSVRNTQEVSTECVVALPGRDLVQETWFTSLPVPRGICEGDLGGLTLIASHAVAVPSILECPVNLECRIEVVKEWYTHYAVFLRVVGASLDEELLENERVEIIYRYPTYEVDDQTNHFGGSIERLGANGELLECPGFPVGARRGRHATTEEWIDDLRAASLLSDPEAQKVLDWLGAWTAAVEKGQETELEPLRRQLTRALELIAWDEWADLHAHLA